MKHRYALLLSHLPHNCSGGDEQIIKLVEALHYIKHENGVLVTSLGSLNWDLQLTMAVQLSIPVVLVLPQKLAKSFTEEQIIAQYGNIVTNQIIIVKTIQERDKEVATLTDTIFPIWNRVGGRMSMIIEMIPQNKVSYKFTSSRKSFPSFVKYEVGDISSKMRKLPRDYLWHWTRSCDGPWPNETIGELCNSIISSNTYPRSALHSLKRIVSQQKLVASGKCVCESVPVVSFTENHPSDMKKHFSWRTGRHRMNFEPYAIGISRHLLEKIGAVPVRYNCDPSWDVIASGDRWKSEKEWRLRGDVSFTTEMAEGMIVIVKDKSERDNFSNFNCYEYEK